MRKYEIINQMRDNGLVAVVRGINDEDIYEKTIEIIKGGIKTIELTFTTPYVENAIEKLSKKYINTNILIGAGTVLDSITARVAILKGAKFIVSPHFDKEIAKICNIFTIPYLPGCGSVTEVINAMRYGVEIIKMFPASVLGIKFLNDIKGPLPNIEVMPSGGVTLDNMQEWIDKKAFALGIGSALTKKGNEYIREETEKFVNKFNQIIKS